MSNAKVERARMVARQIEQRGIHDPRVLDAMRRVPREEFVPDELRDCAYDDSPLPIGNQQTISQPYIVALMIEAAELVPGDRVLEIGAGSGYAAAVMAATAGRVFAIERHAQLAGQAQARFDRLGYDNIELRQGDGSGGWPDAGPFDAILAAAGAPSVPDVLRRQLKIGGRLVMPVGDTPRRQRLLKLTRTDEDRYTERSYGDVLFVPLVGAYGWDDDERAASASAIAVDRPPAAPKPRPPRTLAEQVRDAAEPLPALDDPGFAAMFDRFANARVVLLGEASHGTSEFYRARAAITRRLVEAHGFAIVAVEADWPDAAAVDRDVRGLPPRAGDEPPFQRFPTWMWRNTDVDAFLGWLRGHNAGRAADDRVGFHGLDLYSLGRSMRAVIDYLDGVDPDAARVARERYACMTPWASNPAGYGRIAMTSGHARCERDVLAMLREMLDRQLEYSAGDGGDYLDAAQNARLVSNAEQYYRAMYRGAADSWNLRDRHMFETLEHLLAARGASAKAVVWAHNSHIGDARHTEMGQQRDELNLGQLCRERFGDRAALIGFGTDRGTVAAAHDWDEPMQVMTVNPSLPDSHEAVSHDAGGERFLLDLRPGQHPALREALGEPRLQRFIGVIYRPYTERQSHYAQAELSRQFDAWVWFDRTRAVTPLPTRGLHEGIRDGTLDTYPFGV